MVEIPFEQVGSVIYSPENGTTNFYTNVTIVFSSVGFILSTCALLLLILTACLFAEWRKSFKNQLLIQFMLIRFYYSLIRFYYDLRKVFANNDDDDSLIYLDEFGMLYSEIALLAWMFVFTKQMYNSLVTVFSREKPNLWIISVMTWTVPIFVTAISYALYRLVVQRKLMFFFIYLAVGKWPALITNAVLLIMILRSVMKQNDSKVVTKSNKRLVVVMNIMLWSFCFQQILMDIYMIVFIFLQRRPVLLLPYNIGAMYYCAFSITFWVLGNSNTRKLWRNWYLCVKSHRPLSQQLSRTASVQP